MAANVLPPGSPTGVIAVATVGTVTVVLFLVSLLAVDVQNAVDILVDVSLLPRCVSQLHGCEAP